MTIDVEIQNAESILPGKVAKEGDDDPRWKAIINLGDFIIDNPEKIWTFVSKWGVHKDSDLRAAISSCLLEHLLEYHFELIFPKVEVLVCKNRYFEDTFSGCWKFGESEYPENSIKFDALKNKCLYNKIK